MARGRWLAVGVCTVAVGIGSGLLYLMLGGQISSTGVSGFFPYGALALFAAAPFLAAWLSGRTTPLAAAAGGLALGLGATIAAAAIHPGGTGAMPLALGIGVAGLVALQGSARTIVPRLVAVAVASSYALYSGRLVSVVFVYPLLGLADELADIFGGRRAKDERRSTSVSSSSGPTS